MRAGTVSRRKSSISSPRSSSPQVIGVETDLLFPLASQREIAQGLQRAGVDTRFAPLASIQGHDSFLVDMERFRPVIGEFVASLDG